MGEERTRVVRRDSRKDLIQNPTKDQVEEAFNEASKLVKIVENDPNERKRNPHPTLPDVTKKSGDLIMSVIALRLQGLRDVDIAERLNTSQPRISQLEQAYPDAFLKAKVIATDRAAIECNLGMMMVRAALVEAGPRLVKVLLDLAENPEIKDNVRKDAAIAGLNLLGAGHVRTSKGGKDSDLNKSAANVYIQNIIDKQQEYSTIIETEDAEYVEEFQTYQGENS